MRQFLSTLSLRRATHVKDGSLQEFWGISIHALLAESDAGMLADWPSPTISIHALLAESDLMEHLDCKHTKGISIHALLAESDALAMAGYTKAEIISIHALLAESDPALLIPRMDRRYFYPRSPCGERPGVSTIFRG